MDHPAGRGARRDVGVDQQSPIVVEDEPHGQELEAGGGNGEEVHRREGILVIPLERQPVLSRHRIRRPLRGSDTTLSRLAGPGVLWRVGVRSKRGEDRVVGAHNQPAKFRGLRSLLADATPLGCLSPRRRPGVVVADPGSIYSACRLNPAANLLGRVGPTRSGESRMSKYKIATIIGAPPRFVKAVVVSWAMRSRCDEVIIHAGQHYDFELSGAFFEQLAVPEPAYNLEVGSSSHTRQTGDMMARIEQVLERLSWRDTFGRALEGVLASCA